MGEDHIIQPRLPAPFSTREGRERIAQTLRAALTDVLNAWFPRTIDRDHGGFLCDFDHRWRPRGPQRKMLECQARQTRICALGAGFLPDQPHLRDCAERGFAFLRDHMWDEGHGGWYRMLDRSGGPLEEGTKHGHGSSYAITACVEYYDLTGDEEALSLARRSFTWLDEHAHDDRHGGYHVFYRRDGRPIRDIADSIAQYPMKDAIGTPLGCKDANTTCDLMYAFAVLAEASGDTAVGSRLSELCDLVLDRLVVEAGSVHMFCHADWTPIPDFARYAQALHTANLLREAARVLGREGEARTVEALRAITHWALTFAWDPELGGFFHVGSTFGATHLEDRVIEFRDKYWWAQSEGLELLLTGALASGPDAAKCADHFVRLWRYIEDHLIDARHGGWRWKGLDSGRSARRLPKASEWKDASHEGHALIECIRRIESVGVAPPS